MLLISTSAEGNFFFSVWSFCFCFLCFGLCCFVLSFFFTIFYQLAGFNLFILHPLITVTRGIAINLFLVQTGSPLAAQLNKGLLYHSMGDPWVSRDRGWERKSRLAPSGSQSENRNRLGPFQTSCYCRTELN